MVAGAIGSDMHNTVFMPRNSRALIIAPTSFAGNMDILLAAPKGITLDYYFTDAAGVTCDSQESWKVDIDGLEGSWRNMPAAYQLDSHPIARHEA